MALILVVDDSAYARKRLCDVIRSEGHEVIEAADGNKGLQLITSRKPDCIFLDIIIPEFDGVKILETLKEQGIASPVVVITADIQESTRARCLELGAISVMNKPVKEKNLRRALRDVFADGNSEVNVELTEKQMDSIKELINIGVGRAAGMLNEMTSSHVSLKVPDIQILSYRELAKELKALGSHMLSSVQLSFEGVFSGVAALVFPSDSAAMLVSVLTGEEPDSSDLDSVRAGTLSEVGNIVLNGVMGSIGNILKEQINYSLPIYIEDTSENLMRERFDNDNQTVLLARTRFSIKKLQVEGDIILLFEVGSFDALLKAIDAQCP